MSHERTIEKLDRRIEKLRGMIAEQQRLVGFEADHLENDLRILADAEHRMHSANIVAGKNRANATRAKQAGHRARISELLQNIKSVEDEKEEKAA